MRRGLSLHGHDGVRLCNAVKQQPCFEKTTVRDRHDELKPFVYDLCVARQAEHGSQRSGETLARVSRTERGANAVTRNCVDHNAHSFKLMRAQDLQRSNLQKNWEGVIMPKVRKKNYYRHKKHVSKARLAHTKSVPWDGGAESVPPSEQWTSTKRRKGRSVLK